MKTLTLLAVLLLCGCVESHEVVIPDPPKERTEVDFAPGDEVSIHVNDSVMYARITCLNWREGSGWSADCQGEYKGIKFLIDVPVDMLDKVERHPDSQVWFAPSDPGWHEGPPMIMRWEQEP